MFEKADEGLYSQPVSALPVTGFLCKLKVIDSVSEELVSVPIGRGTAFGSAITEGT